MKLYSELKHPNGLKVFIAASYSNKPIEILEERGVKSGAQLEIKDTITVRLCANSAVLYLLDVTSTLTEAHHSWIQWETSKLAVTLVPYLKSLGENKHDKAQSEALSATLAPLTQHLSKSSSKYMFQDFSAVDIVLFCSLFPLVYEEKGRTYTEKEHPSLYKYLDEIKGHENVKSCLELWYGPKGLCLKPWVTYLNTPHSPNNQLFNLLKNSEPTFSSAEEQTVDQVNGENRKVTEEEIEEAQLAWTDGPEKCYPKLETLEKTMTILPVDGQNNVLITSALPYVNNVPHLGNIIGCVLSGDCFARFCRLRSDNVLYVCGTDEYGTATETKAISENVTPKQICDKYHDIHASVYKWFNISFDIFGRTTTNSQTEITQSIFWDLEKRNRITKHSVDQLHCQNCDRFLADRFVEGQCPHPGCTYEDARGDQCDGCGKLVVATELIKPRCKLCSQTPQIKTSNHLFIDLPQIEDKLKEWIKTSSPQWSSNAKIICDSWLRDGLKERCITRDLKWGTPVPLEGYTDKVFYVWFDAPIGYLSITKEYTNQWEKWWKNPSQVKYYEFMAKDNVPFHSVVFPSSLIASGQEWTMVTHLIATEYLNYEDGKFSKSRGVGVFGDQAKDTNISSDVWRFYLLYMRPENQDTSFSWVDLQTKNNRELLNNLGNFINRSLKFTYQFFDGVVPTAEPTEADFSVMASVNHEYQCFLTCFEICKIRDALRHILSITRIGNQYIQENEPYKLIKPGRSDEDKQRGMTVINVSVNIVALVATILDPYMPETSSKIKDILNNPPELNYLPSLFTSVMKPGMPIKEPSPLIRKITDDEIKDLKVRFAGRCTPSPNTSSNSKEVKNDESNNGVETTTVVDPVEVERLTDLVSCQGSKVRELKTNKAAPADIKIEVEKLLQLKQLLATAQGIKLEPAKKDKKKKK